MPPTPPSLPPSRCIAPATERPPPPPNTKHAREDKRSKNTHTKHLPRRRFLDGVALVDRLLGVGELLVHEALSLLHVERLGEDLDPKVQERRHGADVVQGDALSEALGHGMEDLTDQDGEDGHDGEGTQGSHEGHRPGELGGQEASHEEGLVPDLAQEDQAEGLVEAGPGEVVDERRGGRRSWAQIGQEGSGLGGGREGHAQGSRADQGRGARGQPAPVPSRPAAGSSPLGMAGPGRRQGIATAATAAEHSGPVQPEPHRGPDRGTRRTSEERGAAAAWAEGAPMGRGGAARGEREMGSGEAGGGAREERKKKERRRRRRGGAREKRERRRRGREGGSDRRPRMSGGREKIIIKGEREPTHAKARAPIRRAPATVSRRREDRGVIFFSLFSLGLGVGVWGGQEEGAAIESVFCGGGCVCWVVGSGEG